MITRGQMRAAHHYRERPLMSTAVMADVLGIVKARPAKFSHIFQLSYELGTWSAETMGWNAGSLYSVWLAPENLYERAAEHFDIIKKTIEKLDYVYSVDDEAYLESSGHVDQWGDALGQLRGARWKTSFWHPVRYDHGPLYRRRGRN